MKRLAPVMLAALSVAMPLTAQTALSGEAIAVAEPVITPSCANGVRYDDQSFESLFSLSGPGSEAAAMLFQLPVGTTSLDQACICFSRSANAPANIDFTLLVFDNNGAGGAPGTIVAQVPVTANNIPVSPNRAFYNVNLTSSGLVLPDTSVYVGMSWDSTLAGTARIYACSDRSAGTPQRTVYVGSEGSGFVPAATVFGGNAPRAIGVRVDTANDAPVVCTPSATAMCLNDNRFRVSATFQVEGQPVQQAQVVELTADTGYLWFFDPANVEAVVKVLDGCAVNSRYWVFAGGLTNVRVVITVTDVQTGVSRQFVNPQNTPFQPIQRTDAFATCP